MVFRPDEQSNIVYTIVRPVYYTFRGIHYIIKDKYGIACTDSGIAETTLRLYKE